MDKPEALRLAAVAIFDRSIGWQADATAELRRLHAENELLAGAADKLRVAWRDEVHNLMKDKDQLRAQRDALLEVLKRVTTAPNFEAYGAALHDARAAIKAVEGEKI